MFPTLKLCIIVFYLAFMSLGHETAPTNDDDTEADFPRLVGHEDGLSWVSLDRDGVFRSWAFMSDTVLDAARATREQIVALIATQRGIVPQHIIEMEEQTLADLGRLDVPDEQLLDPPPEVWPAEWLEQAKIAGAGEGFGDKSTTVRGDATTPAGKKSELPFGLGKRWCPPIYCVFGGQLRCVRTHEQCYFCFGGVCRGN